MDSSGGNDGDSGRLPTFKCPRDLSLSGKITPLLRSRKTFVPNIPPKRDRPSPSPLPSSSVNVKTSPSHLRDNARSIKIRSVSRDGSERKKPELIQASSIFAEGLGDGTKGRRMGSRGSRSVGRSIDPESTSAGSKMAKGQGRFGDGEKSLRSHDEDAGKVLEGNLTFQEVQAKVHEMIGDGKFISDLHDEDENIDHSLHAVQLPMSNYARIEWEGRRQVIRIPLNQQFFDPASTKEDLDHPSVVSDQETLDPLSFVHTLITSPQEGTIVLFQMPDQLPVLDQVVAEAGEVKEAKLATNLGMLPEGYIGKMEIFASGATRLVLGQNSFEIVPAKQVSFRQELVGIDLEDKKLTALGQVQHKFLVIPDLEQLFRQAL